MLGLKGKVGFLDWMSGWRLCLLVRRFLGHSGDGGQQLEKALAGAGRWWRAITQRPENDGRWTLLRFYASTLLRLYASTLLRCCLCLCFCLTVDLQAEGFRWTTDPRLSARTPKLWQFHTFGEPVSSLKG